MEHAPAPGPPTGMIGGVKDRAKKRHAPTPTSQPSAWHETDFPGTRSLAAASGRWPCWRWRALVIGWPWLSGRVTIPWDAKAHFLPQIQFLAQSLARGRVAVLGTLRVQRPSADRRPAGDDLLAALPGAGAAQPAPRACGPSMRRVLAMVFLGGAALMLWFRDQGWHWAGGLIAALAFGYGAVDGLAHPARRPGAEPRLSADRACSAWIGRWQRDSIVYGAAAGVAAALHRARARPGRAARPLPARRRSPLWRILATDRPVDDRAREPAAARCRGAAVARCSWSPCLSC